MGADAGLYMYDVVVKKFTFAISSDEFLFSTARSRLWNSLPQDVQSASIAVLRLQLKLYLFQQSCPDIIL